MPHPVMSNDNHTTIDTDSATATKTHIWLTIGLWTVYVDVSNDHNEPHPIVSAWKGEDDTTLNMTASGSFRVYNQEHTPATGGTDYFDVASEADAIALTKCLNELDPSKRWVWA